MNVLVLKTGHEIADTVAKALAEAFDTKTVFCQDAQDPNQYDAVIGYGILRGTDKVFKSCSVPWFEVDNGYLESGHFNGYYRISHRGTQADWLNRKFEAPELFAAKIGWQPRRTKGYLLVVPPTEPVSDFFGIDKRQWMDKALLQADVYGFEALVREKGCSRPLDEDLAGAQCVYTFNSAIGWEALSQGIGCVSDRDHSLVGKWSQYHHIQDEEAVRKLYAFMKTQQFTLPEIAEGRANALVKSHVY